MPTVIDDQKPGTAIGLLRTAELRGGADDFLRRLRDADEPLFRSPSLP